MSLVAFKAKNHPQQVDMFGPVDGTDSCWTQPCDFDPLNAEFGFTLDAAADKFNAKCPKFFDQAANGLEQPWAGEVVWCNPPYSKIRPWIEKAIGEVEQFGCKAVVMLLPANRCEQPWWQELIEPRRDKPGSPISTRFLKGRLRFGSPTNPVPLPNYRPPFGCVVIVVKQSAGVPGVTQDQ